EQRALRRVAVMIAEGHEPDEIFGAVAAAVARVLGAEATRLVREEADGSRTVMAAHGDVRAAADANGRAGLELAVPVVVEGGRWGCARSRRTCPATMTRCATGWTA